MCRIAFHAEQLSKIVTHIASWKARRYCISIAHLFGSRVRDLIRPEIVKCNKVIIQIFVHLRDGFPGKTRESQRT